MSKIQLRSAPTLLAVIRQDIAPPRSDAAAGDSRHGAWPSALARLAAGLVPLARWDRGVFGGGFSHSRSAAFSAISASTRASSVLISAQRGKIRRRSHRIVRITAPASCQYLAPSALPTTSSYAATPG